MRRNDINETILHRATDSNIFIWQLWGAKQKQNKQEDYRPYGRLTSSAPLRTSDYLRPSSRTERNSVG
jgi:hypothetical protein